MKKIFKWFFGIRENQLEISDVNSVADEWILFEEENAPNDVVLVACDTYDCGWVIDTAWWHKEEKCWMTTGSVTSEEAHLPYTHWKELPSPPNF